MIRFPLVRPSVNSNVSRFAVLGALALLSAAAHGQAQQRHPTRPPNRAGLPPAPVPGLVTVDMTTPGVDAQALAQTLIGPGVTVANVQYSGAPVAAGTFTGGTGIVGFAQGVILSSGDIGSVVGPDNTSDSMSTDNLMPADPVLDGLVGGLTQDAAVLEFDFQVPSATVFSFQYVFASEEYDEWVNTQYNDVFAFVLNGQNIALIPGTSTPVAINNVNCGNPWAPPGGSNCALYTSNSCDSHGQTFPCTLLATEMDGLTSVFSATGTVQPGWNHIKLAIADRGDGIYDSNVFLRADSLVSGGAIPVFDPPSPCGQTLSGVVGSSLSFTIDTLATNGYPGEVVTLTASGDAQVLASATFVPPLPAGPAPDVDVECHWTPTGADVGLHHLVFTSTDQLGQVGTCDVWINVVAGAIQRFCFGDGSGAACPCGNESDVGANEGCQNSLGNGSDLVAQGTPSIASDTIELQAQQMPNGPALYFQGTTRLNSGAGTAFGDGLRCVGGTVIRLAIKTNALNQSVFPQGSDPLLSVRGGVAAGDTRHYQVWYRDSAAFCASATYNLSNGVTITWLP